MGKIVSDGVKQKNTEYVEVFRIFKLWVALISMFAVERLQTQLIDNYLIFFS